MPTNNLSQYRRTRNAGVVSGVVAIPPEVFVNQVAWFDAQAIAGLSNSDPVSTWSDISGNGRDATQSGGNRPTYQTNVQNGFPIVRFASASSQYFNLGDISAAFSAAGSVYALLYINNKTGYGVYTHANVDGWWRWSGDGKCYPRLWRTARADAVGAMPSYGWQRLVYESSGPCNMYVNGFQVASVGTGTFEAGTDHRIGYSVIDGDRYFDGDMAELIVYSEVKSAADRLVIEKYLTNKWGLG